MQVKFVLAMFFSAVGIFSYGQAASVRAVLIDALYVTAQKENRAKSSEEFWRNFRVLLEAYALADWSFDYPPRGGDQERVDMYWDDIDDPLRDFFALHGLVFNQKKFGILFKKVIKESSACQGCKGLFTELEVLPSCEHAFCDRCILQHYTSACLCEDCFTNGNESECVLRRAHLACPACQTFMGSDFIYLLKHKPSYAEFIFKQIGRRHKIERKLKAVRGS